MPRPTDDGDSGLSEEGGEVSKVAFERKWLITEIEASLGQAHPVQHEILAGRQSILRSPAMRDGKRMLARERPPCSVTCRKVSKSATRCRIRQNPAARIQNPETCKSAMAREDQPSQGYARQALAPPSGQTFCPRLRAASGLDSCARFDKELRTEQRKFLRPPLPVSAPFAAETNRRRSNAAPTTN